MNWLNFLAGVIFGLSLVLVVACNVLIEQNKDLKEINANCLKQVDSYKTLEQMQNAPMPSSGDAGRFLPDKSLLYVRTSYGLENTCLLFLHELGHAIQWVNNDPCYYANNEYSCEPYAEQFAKENAWRCENL